MTRKVFPALLVAAGTLATSAALAETPRAPVVDASSLPETAVVRPPAQGDERHPVEARLLLEPAVAVPGGTLTVGVHLLQDAGWHTYWVSPGEVGRPTEVKLELPAGAEVAPQQWVVPERFEQSGIVSYGYEHEILHLFEVKLPADLSKGEHRVAADVDWLVCKESCIPGQAHLETTVTVGAAAQHSPFRPLFDHYRSRLPQPASALGGLVVEAVQCRTPVTPEAPFRTVVKVKPAPGHQVARGAECIWPTFAPIVGMNWMTTGLRALPDGDGFLVAVDGVTFAADPLPEGDAVGGLLQLTLDGKPVATEVSAPLPWAASGASVTVSTDPACAAFDAPDAGVLPACTAAAATPPADAPPVVPDPGTVTPDEPPFVDATLMLWNLALAFVGGLILNVMPCVLPVLMLKLYGLVEQVGIAPSERRKAGVAYTFGILASFLALAAGVWGIRNILGGDATWGAQMQHPAYVAGLATAVFLFALSLFGVYEFPTFGAGRAHELSSREGAVGYFFTGVFATLVATPCSAPFLGSATAFAFSAPTYVLVAVFLAVGLGLASPFLLIAFVPKAYELLPRPGAWMEHVKQLLGFTLIATTVWLVGVLFGLVGDDRGVGFLAFLTTAGLGAWIFGRFGGVAADGRRQLVALAGAVLVMVIGGWLFIDTTLAEDECAPSGPVATELAYDEHVPWQKFTPERVDELRGKTLFVDFTADWCISCKVNERTVLETQQVRDAMAQHGVVPLQADFTRQDPVLKGWLDRFHRAGVPMYLVVPPTGLDDAVLLPEVITPTLVTDALDAAAGAQVKTP